MRVPSLLFAECASPGGPKGYCQALRLAAAGPTMSSAATVWHTHHAPISSRQAAQPKARWAKRPCPQPGSPPSNWALSRSPQRPTTAHAEHSQNLPTTLGMGLPPELGQIWDSKSTSAKGRLTACHTHTGTHGPSDLSLLWEEFRAHVWADCFFHGTFWMCSYVFGLFVDCKRLDLSKTTADIVFYKKLI